MKSVLLCPLHCLLRSVQCHTNPSAPCSSWSCSVCALAPPALQRNRAAPPEPVCQHRSLLYDRGTAIGASLSRVLSTLFSRALFHCWDSFVLLSLWTCVAEEDGFCTPFLKCLLSFQLFGKVGIKECTILPLLMTCRCSAGYGSHSHFLSQLHSLHYTSLQKIRLSFYIMDPSLCLTVNCIFGCPNFLNYPFLPVLSLIAHVFFISIVTSVYLLLHQIFHSSHFISGKLVLFRVSPQRSGQYLFGLLRIYDHSLYKNHMLGHISSLAKVASQKHIHITMVSSCVDYFWICF